MSLPDYLNSVLQWNERNPGALFGALFGGSIRGQLLTLDIPSYVKCQELTP